MPHFFINSESVNNGEISISDKENYNHIAKSLRAKPGERLLLIDEKRIQYETVIKNISSAEIQCKVLKSYYSERDLKFDLYLAQSPLRSDAQNFVIEKATELGVRAVCPVITDNCALNKENAEKKIDRWNRIMYEASKQCERAVIPHCEDLSSLEALLNSGRFDKIVAFCERCATKTIRDFFDESPVKNGESLLVIIGPEGGFSEREFDLFRTKSIPMLTLGDLILKAETAVTVALGNIIYEFGLREKN